MTVLTKSSRSIGIAPDRNAMPNVLYALMQASNIERGESLTSDKTRPPTGKTEAKKTSVQEILPIEKAQRMAEFFSVLSDPNRWRILSALAIQEMRVGELAAAVEMSESAVSHQLRVLRNTRLVSRCKCGRTVVYGLKDHHIFNLYRDVSEHLDETDHEALRA